MIGRKRLFLHIGTHKTGTSSFQASLGQNRRKLEKQGYFPVPEGSWTKRKFWQPRRYNLGQVPQSMLREGVATVARLSQDNYAFRPAVHARITGMLLEAIAQRDEPNLILSAEAFTFLRTPKEAERVRNFLDATGREVVIVVVWRNDADWAASWHDHIGKKPGNAERNQARPDRHRADGSWYFDKSAIRAFWAPFGALREVDYDAAVRDEGNVVPALYRAMDVDPRGFKVDIKRNLRSEDDGRD